MHPVHDVDALLLLASALASKRRPAQLVEIMAATDLLHGSIPLDVDLAASFRRLAANDLISSVADGLCLTAAALKIMDSLPRGKSEAVERLAAVRELLAGYAPRAEAATIPPTTEQLAAAILAHRTFLKGPGRNMLVPKPKPAVERNKRTGPWRKPDTGRRTRG